MPRYKLKLSKLDFCSLVDDPAQPNAKTLLIKRKGKRDEVTAQARLAKVNDELGLAFFWAFTSTNSDGTDHYDLHGDAIDADFIKAAMDFMVDGAGAVDEMHDSKSTDGRVVFAMPMTPEIASAYGITTKQSGLMIAIKPTDDQLEKLKDGTYTGVSIAGWGTREPVEMRKGRVCKGQLYTDEVDGHQHQIHCYEDGTFWVSWATADGAENGHSHGIVFEGGKLTILADSGHSHELADGQPGVVVVPADALVVIAARAPIAKNESLLTILDPGSPSVRISLDEAAMKMLETAEGSERLVAKLQKHVAHYANKSTTASAVPTVKNMKPIVLTEAQHAHYSKLSGDDADAFLAKSATEREAIVKAARDADEVIFKGDLTGIEVRKSQGDFAKKLAEANEANAKAAKENAETIAKRDAELEIERLTKRVAQDIGHLAGETAVKVAALRAIDSISDSAVREGALRMLKSADAFAKDAGIAKGVNPGEDASSGAAPQAQLDALITKHATDNKIARPEATAAVLKTTEGRRLYAEANR